VYPSVVVMVEEVFEVGSRDIDCRLPGPSSFCLSCITLVGDADRRIDPPPFVQHPALRFGASVLRTIRD
jgi:hypothetical protein